MGSNSEKMSLFEISSASATLSARLKIYLTFWHFKKWFKKYGFYLLSVPNRASEQIKTKLNLRAEPSPCSQCLLTQVKRLLVPAARLNSLSAQQIPNHRFVPISEVCSAFAKIKIQAPVSDPLEMVSQLQASIPPNTQEKPALPSFPFSQETEFLLHL